MSFSAVQLLDMQIIQFNTTFLHDPELFPTALPHSGGLSPGEGWDAVTWWGWGKHVKGRNYWKSRHRCLVYGVCATRQSHVTSCQIRYIFARHVRKVKGRYGYIDKYLNFVNFEMIQQLKHILQWALKFAASI